MPWAGTALGRWWYEDLGAPSRAPSIVLLHGLMLDRTTWAAQLGALSTLGRVLAFDGPGHGRSDTPPRFDLDEHAAALVEALDAAGVHRAVLVGHSWGGLVALRLALRHPGRVAGLVLLCASLEAEPPIRRMEYEAYLALIRLIGIPRWFVRARVASIVYGRSARRAHPGLADELHGTMVAHPRAGFLRAALAVVRRRPIRGDLGRLAVPTLVLCGREDRTLPPRHSEAIARAIPGASLATVDCGHSPQQERPDRFAAELFPFVQACLSRGSLAARAAAGRPAGEVASTAAP